MTENNKAARIDLRSDNVSTPPANMIDAMVRAWQKPRGYGMREDPDQQELEALSAEMLGMEDALFFPTCTMANQVALMLRCSPGVQVLADSATHLLGFEGSATAGVAGANVARVEGRRGHPTPDQVSDLLARPVPETHMPIRLIWIENTHNTAGGTVMPLDDFSSVVNIGRDHGVPVHVDGARLWNAAAFHQKTATEVVRGADSVAFSLNKALGAPLGAMLVGRRAFISEALRVRNMLGGSWRPAGILASTGVVALRERADRIVDDHRRAARLADALATLNWLHIDRESVQTNIVVARAIGFGGTRDQLIGALRESGILVTPHGMSGIRLVTHADIDDDAVDTAINVFQHVARHHDSTAANHRSN